MDRPTLYPGQLDPDFSQWPDAPGWVDLLRALRAYATRDRRYGA